MLLARIRGVEARGNEKEQEERGEGSGNTGLLA